MTSTWALATKLGRYIDVTYSMFDSVVMCSKMVGISCTDTA
jgi:hypothetical protein